MSSESGSFHTAKEALESHLADHHCGEGDFRSPNYMGGFRYCPVAVALFNQMAPEDRIILG